MGQTSVLNLPLGGGLDQKTSRHYLDPQAKVAGVSDGNFVKVGTVQKRNGIVHIPNAAAAPPTGGNRLVSWSKGSLVALQPGAAYAYSSAEGATEPLGALPPCRVVRRPIGATPAQQTGFAVNSTSVNPTLCDLPYNGRTLRIAIYQSAPQERGLWGTVWDADSGDVVLPPQLLYTSALLPYIVQTFYNAQATATQYQVVVSWIDVSLGQMFACFYNPGANTFSASITLVAAGGFPATGQSADLVPFVGDTVNGGMILVYLSDTVANRVVSYKYLSQSGAVLSSGTVFTAVGGTTISPDVYAVANYAASGSYIWFLFANVSGSNTGFMYATLKGDGTFASVVPPFVFNLFTGTPGRLLPPTLQSAAVLFAGAACQVGVDSGANQISTYGGQWLSLSATSSVAVDSGAWPIGTFPVTRGFVVSGTLYQPVELCLCANQPIGSPTFATQSQQGTLFLLQLVFNTPLPSRLLPVATVAPRQKLISTPPVNDLTTRRLSVPMAAGYSGTRFALGLRISGVDDAAAASGAVASSWSTDFYFDAISQSLLYQSHELGTELHVAGATPFVCDGSRTFEDSFCYYPEYAYAATGGAGIFTGTYSYAVVYTYVDAAGLLHRSVPVFTPPITASANAITVNVPALSLTWRDYTSFASSVPSVGAVYAEVYRTTATPAAPVYYLVDRVAVSNTNSVTIPPAAFVTFFDTYPDAAITTSSILYTTGGVLDNPCPPCGSLQCVHKQRLWIVDETLRTVWFTQQFSPGLAPSWNELMTFGLPDGGDITALFELDDKLVIFKATSIYIVYGGDGPTITGTGSDITNPQKIASDVGALDWRSVVLTPVGLMFLSSSGIYLLDRSLDVTFIGKNVVDSLASYPTVTSATLVPSATHVRFTCVSGAGASAAIVYDYLLQEWTTHLYARVSSTVASSCLSQAGVYSMLTADGQLWEEIAGFTYQDQDIFGSLHFVPTVITTAWVKIQGVQGYQRVRRALLLFDELDDCGLSIGLAVNYQAPIVQTATWASATIDGLPSGLPIDMHMGGAYNKVMSVQFTLSDSQGSNAVSGQGARFVGLAVELDAIGERFRQIPSAGRM